MKNIEIDFVKVSDFYDKYKKHIPLVVTIIIVSVVIGLTFFALYPFSDEELKTKGEERINGLNVNFNSKILNELEAKQQPIEIKGVGGRDPFTSL